MSLLPGQTPAFALGRLYLNNDNKEVRFAGMQQDNASWNINDIPTLGVQPTNYPEDANFPIGFVNGDTQLPVFVANGMGTVFRRKDYDPDENVNANGWEPR